MSNLGTPTTPILPSITGNVAIDGLIRGTLLSISAATTAVIVTWLNAHGFNDPNLTVMISGGVFSALSVVAIMGWGWISHKRSEVAAEAAQTTAVKATLALAHDDDTPTPVAASVSPGMAKEIVAIYADKA